MADLKNRGVRDILITCCDGLAGFEAAITSASGRPSCKDALSITPACRLCRPRDGSWWRRSYESRKGRHNRGGLIGTHLFGSAEEEGGDHW